jgi:hypothetical protein
MRACDIFCHTKRIWYYNSVICGVSTEPKTGCHFPAHFVRKLKWPKGRRKTVVFRMFDTDCLVAKTKLVASCKIIILLMVK